MYKAKLLDTKALVSKNVIQYIIIEQWFATDERKEISQY